MNSFSRQGKALPNRVREGIIEKYLDNYSITTIATELCLPYKTVSNIVDVWLTRPTVEPKVGGNKFRTARTDDVIAYTEFLEQNTPSTYGKEIQRQLVSHADAFQRMSQAHLL